MPSPPTSILSKIALTPLSDSSHSLTSLGLASLGVVLPLLVGVSLLVIGHTSTVIEYHWEKSLSDSEPSGTQSALVSSLDASLTLEAGSKVSLLGSKQGRDVLRMSTWGISSERVARCVKAPVLCGELRPVEEKVGPQATDELEELIGVQIAADMPKGSENQTAENRGNFGGSPTVMHTENTQHSGNYHLQALRCVSPFIHIALIAKKRTTRREEARVSKREEGCRGRDRDDSYSCPDAMLPHNSVALLMYMLLYPLGAEGECLPCDMACILAPP